jgi:hypothetical protein
MPGGLESPPRFVIWLTTNRRTRCSRIVIKYNERLLVRSLRSVPASPRPRIPISVYRAALVYIRHNSDHRDAAQSDQPAIANHAC